MDLQIIEKILEEGGQISCNGIILMFEERWNRDPDKEWSGFSIINNNKNLYRTMRLSEALEKYYEIIEQENIINDK